MHRLLIAFSIVSAMWALPGQAAATSIALPFWWVSRAGCADYQFEVDVVRFYIKIGKLAHQSLTVTDKQGRGVWADWAPRPVFCLAKGGADYVLALGAD